MELVEIDGSYGSGGGQIIRTALALSALTCKAFHIKNIRAKRKNPGLAAQHLSCINAVAKLCNAKTKNVFISSTELFFEPCNIEIKNLKIDIGTAGSISLVLQALMPALTAIDKEIEIQITGGTDVKMAPSIDYMKNVLLKLLSKLNYNAEIQVVKRGFYPKGNGLVLFKFKPAKLTSYNFTERGKLVKIEGSSIASMQLEKAKVAERQASEAERLLVALNLQIKINHHYAESLSTGSIITLWLNTENSIIGGSSIGEKGKTSEEVAREAASSLMNEIKSDAVVDFHAADQLLPYLALIEGSLKTSKISEHVKTNAWVIEKFLPIKFEISEKQNIIKCKKI